MTFARRLTALLMLATAMTLVATPVGAALNQPPDLQQQQPLPDRVIGVGKASQLLIATTSGYGSTYATFTAWQHDRHGWDEAFGPWTARVGAKGFAPRGSKREGDLRTPSGSFPLEFAFGVDRNPGVHVAWRHAATWDFWDDDSSSPRYNLWTDIHRHSAGVDPEPMHDVPSYEDGIVIGYNLKRVPHLGSAIFLHVNNGAATTGCVSLPRSRLIRVLRWLRPSQRPRIVMGTSSEVTR